MISYLRRFDSLQFCDANTGLSMVGQLRNGGKTRPETKGVYKCHLMDTRVGVKNEVLTAEEGNSGEGQFGNDGGYALASFPLRARQAVAMSGAFELAETTQIRRAPAARTSSMLARLMPPMANQGMETFVAAQRT